MFKRIKEKIKKIKRQRNCPHEDTTIIASDSDYAVLYCYDCEKEWVEKC
jgi:hypothetical protein